MDKISPANKPEIRVLHHMARSGGTIISRCLGCMQGIHLLSEINPRGIGYFNPLAQAHEWYGLLTPADIAELGDKGGIDFVSSIVLIHQRSLERGGTLVIRDWSHADFTGWPHFPDPSYRLTTARLLSKHFHVINTATVRHPIDQWLSFRKSQEWTNSTMPLEQYLHGYRKFAEQAADIEFVRYEEFTRQPAEAMATLCKRLQIPFDPEFESNWSSYNMVTTAPGERDGGARIALRERPSIAESLMEQFGNNMDYREAIAILGYSHPQ